MKNTIKSANQLVLFLFFVVASTSASQVTPMTVLADSKLYSNPKSPATVVKQLKKGEVVSAYLPARNGFVAVIDPTAKKIVGWVSVTRLGKGGAVDRRSASLSTLQASAGSSLNSRPKNSLLLMQKALILNPSTFRAALGSSEGSSLGFAFGAAYSMRFTPEWAAEAQLTYLDTSSDYLLSMFQISMRAIYFFLESGALSVGATAGLGTGISSFTSPLFPDAQNLGQLSRIKTASILSFPLFAGVTARYRVLEVVGLSATFGYEINSLGELPYTRNLDESMQSATFSASGLVFSLAGSFDF